MEARFVRAGQTGQAILPRAKWAILTILSGAKRVVLPAILSGAKRVVLPAILSGAKRVVLPAILAALWLGASARAEDFPPVPRAGRSPGNPGRIVVGRIGSRRGPSPRSPSGSFSRQSWPHCGWAHRLAPRTFPPFPERTCG
jgi:hypothetical protein